MTIQMGETELERINYNSCEHGDTYFMRIKGKRINARIVKKTDKCDFDVSRSRYVEKPWGAPVYRVIK